MFDHNLPFDPTHGYDLTRLLEIRAPAEPEGYAEFWRLIYALTRSVPLNLQTRPSPLTMKGYDVLEAYYDGLDGFRVGAWVLLPQGAKPKRAVVCGHGYGQQTGPGTPNRYMPEAAWIFPSGRGFGLSAHPDLPATAQQHVVYGIESRRTYLHLGCVADLWSSLDAITAIVPEARGRVDFSGGSFGGGIGAMALAFEHRFRKAYLHVPSFGHHPLRLTMPCTGSGESVRTLHQAQPGVVQSVLPYFDAAVAARYVTRPTLVSAALFDPAVPPAGQFAVANELVAGGAELVVIPAGHFDYRGLGRDNKKLARRVGEFFEEGE